MEDYLIGNNKTVLGLFDTHFPDADKNAINLAIKYGKKRKIDVVFLGGDIGDLYSISRFDKDPDKIGLREEIDLIKDFLIYIKQQFPKSKVVYLEGNHELWLEKYRWSHKETRNDYTLNLEDISKSLGVVFLKNGTRTYTNDLLLLHGNEAKGCIGKQPANAMKNKLPEQSVLFGNAHKTTEAIDLVITANDFKRYKYYSVGCLCGLSPDYMKINNWNLGFCIINTSNNTFEVENKVIIGNKTF